MKKFTMFLSAFCAVLLLSQESAAWPVSNPEMINVRLLFENNK